MSASPNVLVVDDEPGMLRYMKTVLELDSYTVSTAHCGEDAIQSVRDGAAPDLVLLDLVMPGIDGLQTLEQLRRQPNRPLGGGELQRVVQQIRNNMLHFIEVKRKALDGLRFEVIKHHQLLLKRWQPNVGNLRQTSLNVVQLYA